jgi:hypothetical protein
LCLKCQKSFSFGKKKQKTEITRRHLEDASSYRTIQKRDGFSKNTALKYVHELGAKAKDSFWIAENLKPQWSGILCFDGTYIAVKNAFVKLFRQDHRGEDDERFLHKMIVLLGTDYHTRDLPHYSLGDNENMIDLVMYFQQLQKNGYDLKVLVRDGNSSISEAAEHVYGSGIPVQLCQRHFLAKFDEKIANRELQQERENILELKRRVWLIIRSPEIEIACQRMNEFVQNKGKFENSMVMKELVFKFLRDFEQLTMYLQYPKGQVPPTSNISENMNYQLKNRLRSICSFQSIVSAENYLKLWCLKRRFHKFTDCKAPHRHLNGKAPLELAGCNIRHLDYLHL